MAEGSLDRDWPPGSLLAFALPTVVMMVFMGLCTLTDALFAARFVNTDALSAVNIVCPVINVTVGLGTMLAAGGNALVSRKLGAGREREAREDFTLLILAGAAAGILLLLAAGLSMGRILRLLGARGRLVPYCRQYLSALIWFLPANVLQTLFANLFVTAGRPGLGSGLSVLAGGANLLLDYLFMVPGGLGIRGAALGTGISWLIPALAGLLYFGRKRGSLYFTRPGGPGALWESCLNGSSELVSQLASAVTTWLFNRAMLELAGEEGVAAVTILIYTQFLLNTLFIGFSIGTAPIIGFNHGSGNRVRQRRVFRISMGFLAAVSLGIFALCRLGGPWIAGAFAPGAPEVFRLASEGFGIFSFSFLFCGLNGYASGMFTALSNARVSAALSLLRTFGLLGGGLLLLPRIWGITGVWLAAPMAEGIMAGVTAACLLKYRGRYGY